MSSSVNPAQLGSLGLVATGGKVLLPGRPAPLDELFPVSQVVSKRDSQTTDIQIPCNGVPSNLFNNSGARYQATIQRGAVDRIKHITMKIDVTVNGAASVLAPTTHWFRMIELRAGQGGRPVKTWYNDMLLLGGTADKQYGQFQSLFEGMNLDSSDKSFLGQTLPLQPGVQKSFYLPLESHIFSQIKADWLDAKFDLCLFLQPDDSGIVVSGGGTVTCNGITLILESEDNTSRNDLLIQDVSRKFAQSSLFVDPVPIYESSHVLNAGRNLFDMQSPQGRMAGFFVLIRPVGAGVSNVNNGWLQCINIGDESGATLDILDASQKSVLGGQPLPTKLLRHEKWIHTMNNPMSHAKPFYLIQHCEGFSRVFTAGEARGYRRYIGDQCMLQIGAVAGVNEVQTITCANAVNAGGVYRFKFKEELSAPLPYNASPAQMAAAVKAMRTMLRDNITVVFSGSMQGTITATFTTPATNGLNGELLTVVTESLHDGGGALDIPMTTITTPGRDGIVNGQAYNIRVYALLWKKATWAGGALTSEVW